MNELNLAKMMGLELVVISTLAFAITILIIIARWKIFTKAGEDGIASLIPIYGEYVFAKIVFKKGWFFLIEIFSSLLVTLGGILQRQTNPAKASSAIAIIPKAMTVVGAVIFIGYTAVSLFMLAKRFNKSILYSVIMAISPFLCCGIVSFFMILSIAFGSEEYDKSSDEYWKDITEV